MEEDFSDDAPVRVWMREHGLRCGGGYKTGAWYGLQWENCRDYINVQCSGCGESYIEHDFPKREKPLGSSRTSTKSETKNSAKEEKHEKNISTRKIGKWKIRSGR